MSLVLTSTRRQQQLRTLLILGRVSNLPTVWSNCLAGWLLGGGGSVRRLVLLCLASSCLYIGGMFLNVSGRVRVFLISAGGDEATLYTVQRGESCLLSTSALFAEMRFPASVEVETAEVKIFFIPAAAYRTLYRDEPGVRDFTVNELSGRVFDLLAALEERSLRSIEDRLKGYLIRRVDGQGEVAVTHEQIALSLGTAREVVSRKLGQMGKAGWIRTHRGRIRLLKPKLLA